MFAKKTAFVHTNKQSSPFHRSSPKKPPFKDYGIDHLVKVTGFDISNARIHGVDQFGKQNTYQIDPAKFAAQEASSAKYGGGGALYFKHRIDIKMRKVVADGDYVVAERATLQPDGLHFCNRVQKTNAGSNAAKNPVGIFTVDGWLDNEDKGLLKLMSVQKWQEKSFSAFDQASLAKAAELFASVKAKRDAGEYPVGVGFQMRSLMKTDAGWSCFDGTHPYDWIPEEKSVVSKEWFLKTVADYILYTQDMIDPPNEVDIMLYKTFKASDMSSDNKVRVDRLDRAGEPISALGKMATREGKISEDDAEGYYGKLWAVDGGILVLTKDPEIYDANGNVCGHKSQNIAQRIHANNKLADVRELVFAPDGGKVSVAGYLKKPFGAKKSAESAQNADIVQPAPKDSFSQLPVDAIGELWDDADPFGTK